MASEYKLDIMQYVKTKNFFKNSKTRKDEITQLQMANMLRRTARMFEWKGLPDTIPQRVLELSIQTRGYTGIINLNDKFYSVYGSLGGKFNYNYMPSWCIVANPYLKGLEGSRTFYIYDQDENKKDIVIIPNDSLYQGLIPLLSYHSELLTEIQLTKRCIMILSRMPKILTAPNNNAKSDLDGLLKDLEEGEISSMFDKNMLMNIGSVDLSDGTARNLMTQVLETEQYQKAAMFNDVGLQLNYNMKRETITSSEAQLGEGALLPLPDDMMEMRRIKCKELKDTFDLNWSVEFASAWKDLHKSIQVGIQVEESKIEGGENNVDQETVQSIGQDGTADSEDLGMSDTETDYQEAVQVVEPIIQATKEVIENIAEGEENADEDKETS